MFYWYKIVEKLSDVFFISLSSLVVDDSAANGCLYGNHEDAVVLAVRVQVGELVGRVEPLEGLSTARVVVVAGWGCILGFEVAEVGLGRVEAVPDHCVAAPGADGVLEGDACVFVVPRPALVAGDLLRAVNCLPLEVADHLVEAGVVRLAAGADLGHLALVAPLVPHAEVLLAGAHFKEALLMTVKTILISGTIGISSSITVPAESTISNQGRSICIPAAALGTPAACRGP